MLFFCKRSFSRATFHTAAGKLQFLRERVYFAPRGSARCALLFELVEQIIAGFSVATILPQCNNDRNECVCNTDCDD